MRTEGKPPPKRSRRRPDPFHIFEGEGRWAGYIDSERYYPDPRNPTQEVTDFNRFNPCRHDQCESRFCLGAGGPGVFVQIPVCSRPCRGLSG